jgi:hypothetical protein
MKKYNYKCKKNCTKIASDKEIFCINECDRTVNSLFDKYSTQFKINSEDNKLCLVKCTDKLNFPSEELTCYDKCEEVYNSKLMLFKSNLFNDFNKILK